MSKAKIDDNKNYVYVVQCSDGSLYTGWTTDVTHRVQMHNSGKGAKYTRSRRPVKLVYCEEFPTKEDAMRREAFIKKLTPEKKRQLVSGHNDRK